MKAESGRQQAAGSRRQAAGSRRMAKSQERMVVMRIEVFNPRMAREIDWQALNEFQNQLRAEEWPEDLPRPVEKTRLDYTVLMPTTTLHMWLARTEDGTIVASGECWIEAGESNQHLAWTGVRVVPEYRRRGLGRDLLKLVASAARAEGRAMLMAETDDDVPAGEAFAVRWGATHGLDAHSNRLDLAGVDRNLVDRWQAQGRERAADFSLGWWLGALPDEALPDMVQLVEGAMNDEPRGDLDLEDERLTPAQVREWDNVNRARKIEQWTVYARETATGAIAGYSQVRWSVFEPDTIRQCGTGVMRPYRNRGLGRWLKATMLDKILRERPEVRRIRTGNATSNGPMLKINYELGFKPEKTWHMWQIELDKLEPLLVAEMQPELALAL